MLLQKYDKDLSCCLDYTELRVFINDLTARENTATHNDLWINFEAKEQVFVKHEAEEAQTEEE